MKRGLGIFAGVIAIGVLVFLYSSSLKINGGNAYQVNPELILKQLTVLKEQEFGGDEIYITLNVRRSGFPVEYIRIPQRPDHWLSRQIDLVKDIHLWSAPVIDGETVTIMVELNEQNMEPMNPDDLLGMMRVKIKNEKGKLDVHWDVPNQWGNEHSKKLADSGAETKVRVSSHVEKFDFQNEDAHYEMYLMLKK